MQVQLKGNLKSTFGAPLPYFPDLRARYEEEFRFASSILPKSIQGVIHSKICRRDYFSSTFFDFLIFSYFLVADNGHG